MPLTENIIQIGDIRLHVRDWRPEVPKPDTPAFVLLHGLASNAKTWDFVAQRLSAAGYRAVAVDQRGHGLSGKPDEGYDFAAISADLFGLVSEMELNAPILAGQSWGGNVVLETAARFPEITSGLIFVDGGFLDLSARGSWEAVSNELRPPNLIGVPREMVVARIRQAHPDWGPEGIDFTLGNFEIQPDDTVRPRLALENHMAILRAMYDQKVLALYPQLRMPVLICAADDGSGWTARKRTQVETAAALIPEAAVRWMKGAHDLHIDQHAALTAAMIDFASTSENL